VSDSLPIGVFDSGVGGLTVVKEIRELLPNESIIYVGDTARVPYGNKSPETIQEYATQITRFLVEKKVKAVVVACNTATAYSLDRLRELFSIPLLGVIEPGVGAALSATRGGRIGIIGTVGTIQSHAYQNALLKARPDLSIQALATPLLVPLVEEDWLDHPATDLILKEYLQSMMKENVDTLVLGCTHYPLLKPRLQSIVQDQMTLVDSAENMAKALKSTLESHGLLNSGKERGNTRIYVTDYSPRFRTLAERFLKCPIEHLERITLG
jgi:glutamate racemase